jgi:hypothetical protein
MSARLANVTGTVTTTLAGVLLAALSLSAFGGAPSLFGFLALLLVATAAHRALSRQR